MNQTLFLAVILLNPSSVRILMVFRQCKISIQRNLIPQPSMNKSTKQCESTAVRCGAQYVLTIAEHKGGEQAA